MADLFGGLSPAQWITQQQHEHPEEYGLPANTTSDSEGNDFLSMEPEPSLSQYMNDNPGLGYEDYLKWMSQHSDEWAEKYLDYLTERGELDRANEYTANREDTAYQRLVSDLQKAGLNPAMMYGSSASISASGSQGYVKMSEGANSRAIGNYSKLKKLVLSYLAYQLESSLGTANSIFKGINSIGSIIKAIFD